VAGTQATACSNRCKSLSFFVNVVPVRHLTRRRADATSADSVRASVASIAPAEALAIQTVIGNSGFTVRTASVNQSGSLW
jgi:hypothetical protein